MLSVLTTAPLKRIRKRFHALYGRETGERQVERLVMMTGRYGVGLNGGDAGSRWSQEDAVLITYADMVQEAGAPPLATLGDFLDRHVAGAINTVHILPFFPYSSDDGFSVIDYLAVKADYGTWDDVQRLGQRFDLMFDLVLNHVSGESGWFRNYVSGVAPHSRYFIEIEPGTDLSAVVRPRVSPLLRETQTRSGSKFVWTTFSEDQVDLDFRNPDVLFEFLDILFYYVAMGARIVRLDAIAYLWKEVGTSCIHLKETHEVVRLLHDILALVAPHVLLLTETNVPHPENVSYFGNGDEADMVYQFALPPLLLHAFQTGEAGFLTRWAANLAPPPRGCTFLNFTASHDGIGVRPAEGILPPAELDLLLHGVQRRGGHVSSKTNADGSASPYELNITYFDALSGDESEAPALHTGRFLCSQALAMSLRGIPAVYFNSLVAARNNHGGVELTGQARTINRGKWQLQELESMVADSQGSHGRVFTEYARLLRLRAKQPAFHPDAEQHILELGSSFFGLVRTAKGDEQRLVALFNVRDQAASLDADELGRQTGHRGAWHDLVADQPVRTTGTPLVLSPYQVLWLVPA